MRVPKLRFPEFKNAGEWEIISLKNASSRITERVGVKVFPTVSISAGTGFVSQTEKFGRDISGDQYKNYIVLKKGDFAYNKGNSKRYPQGCIYRLVEFDQVAVPNAFICFRFKTDYVADFYKQYFEANIHGIQLKKFITSGARSDGLLNIKPDDFFSISFASPCKPEQQKIADCLSSLDELIAAHNQKLTTLKIHKKGLIQHLFPAEGETVPKLRFPEFRNKGKWAQMSLSDICRMQAGKSILTNEIREIQDDARYPCYGGNGLRGYVKSFTHDGCYPLIGRQGALCGNVTYVNGPFYATEHAIVCIPNDGIATEWLYYQLVNAKLNQYATGQAQPGLSVENLDQVQVNIPMQEHEQQRIAGCLSSLDNLIAAHSNMLTVLKTHKKGLMQQLFPVMMESADE